MQFGDYSGGGGGLGFGINGGGGGGGGGGDAASGGCMGVTLGASLGAPPSSLDTLLYISYYAFPQICSWPPRP